MSKELIEKELKTINATVQTLWKEMEIYASKGASGKHPSASDALALMGRIRAWEGKRHALENLIDKE